MKALKDRADTLKLSILAKAHSWRSCWRPEDETARVGHWSDLLRFLEELVGIVVDLDEAIGRQDLTVRSLVGQVDNFSERLATSEELLRQAMFMPPGDTRAHARLAMRIGGYMAMREDAHGRHGGE